MNIFCEFGWHDWITEVHWRYKKYWKHPKRTVRGVCTRCGKAR